MTLHASAAEFLRKLGAKPGHRLLLVSAPASFSEWLASDAVALVAVPTLIPKARADILLLWLRAEDDLDVLFARAEKSIPPDGAVWVVIPRKATPKGKTFPHDFAKVQAAGLKTSLVDNKDLKFTDDEYGIRFVIRRERRTPLPAS